MGEYTVSNVVQLQRRALESINNKRIAKPVVLKRKQRYFLVLRHGKLKKIFLRGISNGVGTRSDVKGVFIAVFSDAGPSDVVLLKVECGWAAFLREPTRQEELADEESDPDTVRMLVEGLTLKKQHAGRLYFVKNRKKKTYIQL